MAATLLQTSQNTFSGTGNASAALANVTGNDVMVFVVVSSRGINTFQTHSATYDGFAMDFVGGRDENLSGFAGGRILVFKRHIGNVVNKTANCVVDTFSGANTNTTFSCYAFSNLVNAGATGTAGEGIASAGGSTSLGVSSDFAVGVLQLAGSSIAWTNTGDQTVEWNIDNTTFTSQQHVGEHLRNDPGPTSTVSFTFPGSSFNHFIAGFEESAVASPPIITSVNGGVDVPATSTGIPIIGTAFLVGNTAFWYADGTNFATATKVQQNIDTITTTTFNWTDVDVGAVGGGANWVFAVTDPGGGSEQISVAFAVTVNVPDAPVILNVDGGATADVTDTNLTINGTTLFTVGTSQIWLADGTNFGTATKVLQSISAITTSTINWDDVDIGGFTPGLLYLFCVTDEGGLNELISSAFVITITEPTVPGIVTIDGQVPAALVVDVGVNLPIVGTDFNPGGVTQIWLADGTNFGTATKFVQTISAITTSTINWDAVDISTLSIGLLYVFCVTEAGGPKERVSFAFAVIALEVIPPVITAVNGGNSVLVTAINLVVTGTFINRPGTPQFWLADGTDFGLATKTQQTIDSLAFFNFIWPTIVLGALSTGQLWLFYLTDVGGPNEQISLAFVIMVNPVTIPVRIEMIGDGYGSVLSPVRDESEVDPDQLALVLRDHANHTGLGTWYLGRDFVQDPNANGTMVLKGGLPGPWPIATSIRINQVVPSNRTLLADEQLDVFTEAVRSTITAGVWIHKTDLVNLSDIDTLSIWQLETSGPGYYVELFAELVAGEVRLGVAYDNGTRETLLHTIDFKDPSGDWLFIVGEWSDSAPFLRIVQGGVDVTGSPGSGPQAGLYTSSFLVHDFTLVGGANTPNIYLRLCALYYGFGTLTLGEISTLESSFTQNQYELSLRTILGSKDPGTTGPIHYYRMDDIIPDRFLHNHAEDFTPGRIVGGLVQRNLSIGGSDNAKRLVQGATCVCPTSPNASFTNWEVSMIGHFRYNGLADDEGVICRVYNSITGGAIELYKLDPGIAPNELNGRIRFRTYDNVGVPSYEFIWPNPAFDIFDGLFHAISVTTSELPAEWQISVGTIGSFTTTNVGIDNPLPDFPGAFDTFEFGGGLTMDVHSWGYLSEYNSDVHSFNWYTWSLLLDLIGFAQDRNFDGFYWCQNEVVND